MARFVQGVRACLELCRLSNLPTLWTNVLAAEVLAGAGWRCRPGLGVALALSCFYLGGMVLNDVLDIDEDRAQKPFRPLPSQRLSTTQAWSLVFTLFGTALAVLLVVFRANLRGFFAGLMLLAAIVLYDLFHRRHAVMVLLMATCRGLVFVVAALAIAGAISRGVALAAAVQSVYIVFLSLVARREKRLQKPATTSVMPWILAGISLVDGLLLAILARPAWLFAGIVGAGLTRLGQLKVRGD